MKSLTERQRWMLRRAVARGHCEIHGRGGMSVARGIEKRGLGKVEFELVGREIVLVYVLRPTQAGREEVASWQA